MNLLYPYEFNRVYGDSIPILSEEQYVPLFLTNEVCSPYSARDLRSISTGNNVWFTKKLCSVIESKLFNSDSRAVQKKVVDLIRKYLVSVLTVPKQNSYVTSVPMWILNNECQKPMIEASRSAVFSGVGSPEVYYSSNSTYYIRKGLILQLGSIMSMCMSSLKTKHYTETYDMASIVNLRKNFTVICLVLIQAGYVDYVRARNSLGLPLTLPYNAIRILINSEVQDKYKLPVEVDEFMCIQDKPAESVPATDLLDYLFIPRWTIKERSAHKVKFLSNIVREIERIT